MGSLNASMQYRLLSCACMIIVDFMNFYLIIIFLHYSFIFQPASSNSECGVAGVRPGSSEFKLGTLDRRPSHCQVCSCTQPHSLRLESCRHTKERGHLWDVGRNWSTWRKPTWENVQIPHRQWLQPGIDFFFFSHQCYDKAMLKETVLFWDLPYYIFKS